MESTISFTMENNKPTNFYIDGISVTAQELQEYADKFEGTKVTISIPKHLQEESV